MKKNIPVILNVISFIIMNISIIIYYKWNNIVSALLFFLVLILNIININIKDDSYANPKNVFSIVFFFTIGLALLKLHHLQTIWEYLTFITLEASYYSFLIGFDSKITKKIKPKENISEKKFINISNIVFYLSTFAFLLEVLVFKESIPLFSRSMSSYKEFGVSGLHYFTCAICLYLPCAFIQLYKYKVKNKLSIIIKGLIAVFIPILIVSRQLLIMEAIMIVILYILFNRKKQNSILLKGGLVILSMWLILGQYRNQNEEYIKYSLQIQDNPPISVKAMNLYMYFAFNYDNLNNNIKTLDKHSYGYRSFFPIFAFTGTKNFVSNYLDVQTLKVIPTFTTYPIQNTPYTDFGIIGVIIYMYIIGKISKIIMIKNESGNEIYLILYSMILYALILSFFTSFFSNASFLFDFILLEILSRFKVGDSNV